MTSHVRLLLAVPLGVFISASASAQPVSAGDWAPSATVPSPAALSPAAPAPTAEIAREDVRAQYPAFLVNSYFSVGLSHVGYGFSGRQLEPGFTVGSVAIPHLGARVVLFGHRFTPRVSAEAVYARPVGWVSYRDVNGDGAGHSVWMNVGALIVKRAFPIDERLSVFGEGGFAVVSRHGFEVDGTPAVASSVAPGVAYGGGVDYQVNDRWDLTADVMVAQTGGAARQPATHVASAGLRYTMRELPAARVAAVRQAGAVFPEHVAQLEYSTSVFGYGLNRFFTHQVPIFWAGNVNIERGAALRYERNLFHTERLFGLNLGLGGAVWRSDAKKTAFVTLAVYPVLQFTVVRSPSADLFVSYSVAGPSFISRSEVDGHRLGRGFTFQDFLGAGVVLGVRKQLVAQVKIAHYSNGNFLADNGAVKVPTTFSLGYVFQPPWR